MIAYLQGIVMRKTDRKLVVNVSGVGYAVQTTTPLLAEVSVGDTVALHIHTSVTENDIVLYGFLASDECTFFEQLTSVSGIGSKTALQILSQPADVVRHAILTEDIPTLTKLPGIGRKTAERLIVELKDKIVKTGGATVSHMTIAGVNIEALEALISLGFPRHEAVRMLSSVPGNISEPREVVQYALRQQQH